MSDIFVSEVVVEPGTSPIVVDGSAVTQPVSGTVNVGNFPATQPVSGTVNVGNFPATQPVSGTVTVANPGLTDTQLRASPVPTTSAPVTSNTANITQVAASNGVNIQLLAANANRKKAILYFPKGSSTSYLKFGATASATSFTYLISSNGTVLEISTWVGQLDFNGIAQTVTITELV